MYLTLPLPSTVTRTMTVTVFYANGSGLPMPFTVTLMKHGCCKDLILALSTACCLKIDEGLLLAEVMIVISFSFLVLFLTISVIFLLQRLNSLSFFYQVYNHQIFRFFENPAELISSIKDDEHIVAYRFDRKQGGKIKLEIVNRWQEK